MIYELLERFVGFRERKLGAVLLIGIGGLAMFSLTSDFFSWLDKGLENFPLFTLRNLLAVLLIIIAIGWWKNRI